LITAVIIDVLL